ncbi:MAG: ESPR-type extended signal peptide-containing protein [Acinetobacter tjernbergiae]
MNHIFKKIWNKAQGCVIVVSEHAKSAGKTDNTTGIVVSCVNHLLHQNQGKNEGFVFKPLVIKSLVLSITIISGANVWAGIVCGGSTGSIAAGNNATACGVNNTAPESNTSALGFTNQALGSYSNAIGSENIALGSASSAIGRGNRANNVYSSALGFGNTASGVYSSAVGSASGWAYTLVKDTAGKITTVGGITVTTTGAGTSLDDIDSFIVNGVTITKASNPTAVAAFINAARTGGNIAAGDRSSAMGTGNIASGNASSAVGYNNKALSNSSSALGFNNTASGYQSSAVGLENTTSDWKTSALGNSNSASGEISAAIGNYNVTNKRAGVALGLDNYAQNLSSAAVGTRKIADQTLTPIVTGGVITSVNGINVTATGTTTDTITHVNGTVVTAEQRQAFLDRLGWSANFALADESSVFGVGSIVTANQATAIGYDSLADESNTISVGRVGQEKRVTNVATPIKATDAANKGYVDTALTKFTGNIDNVLYDIGTNKATLTLAGGATGTKITNLKDATLNATSSDAVTGKQLYSIDGRITGEVSALNTRIGTEAGTLNTRITNEVGTLNTTISGIDGRVTINTNDIALLKTNTGNLAANAVIYDNAVKDTISLAGGTNGTKITNLKNGTADSDAVNFGQLKTKADQTALTVGLANTLTDAKGYTDQKAATLDGKITANTNTINTRIDGVDTRLGNEVATLNTKIGTEVGTLTTTISGIDRRVTTNTNDIAALQNGLGGISANAVVYDSATKDTVTLKGTNGTKLTGLHDASLDANSKDAVTGKQLHATNTNLATLDSRVTSEVSTLDSKMTTSANTINTRINGVDTRIANEVATLNTRVDTTNTAVAQVFGGGAIWGNGGFTAPTYTIQGQAKNNVADAFVVVDQQLGGIKTSVSNLKTYTNQQATSTLNDAKNYADQQTSTALNNAKSYTNQQATSTLNDAKSYADQKAADGKAYTDQQATLSLNNAKSYADQKAADGKAYTDQQTTSALNDAKSYADQKAASSLSGAKDYTDQKTASAISSANSYTDSKIADVQTQLTASNQFVQVNGVANAQAASATGENSVAIGANTVVTGNRSTAMGVGNQVSGNGSGAFGDPNIVSGNGSYAVGNDNKVTGDNTFVLGNNVDTKAKNAVVLGNDSESNRDNTVSLGAKGKERQVIHVADATEDTDAVNYQQLKASEKSVNSYTNERVGALNSAFQDYRLETEQRFQKVDERFNRQGAMTAAMMNMASSASSVKGQNRVGVGAGFQGQEQAVSIGYQRIINENTSLTIGGAFTKEESSGGVGVGFGW